MAEASGNLPQPEHNLLNRSKVMSEVYSSTLPPDAKPIPGYIGYAITPRGELYSCHLVGRYRQGSLGVAWRKLKLHRDKMGYWATNLVRDAGHIGVRVHVLVAMTFLGPPLRSTRRIVARHLDGNPSNNNVSNIAWGTQADNSADSFRHGTRAMGDRNGRKKINSEIVRKMRQDRMHGMQFKAIASKYSVSLRTAYSVIRRETWRYVE